MTPDTEGIGPTGIVVQIVHIEGPRKGQIDENTSPVITIGRNLDSDVIFPKDALIVSRKHAEIRRQGNSFLLVNHSANGCYVNGRLADNVYLKQGDVIAFAEGGPKVSFLYTVKATAAAHRPASPASPPSFRPATPPAAPKNSAPAGGEVAPYTIQYGTSIKSFKKTAVKIGKDPGNDFVLEHSRVFGAHAEISYHQGQYYLGDLTASRAMLLNGKPITAPTPLQESDVLTFGEGGPALKYIGTGRFSEVLS